MSWRLSVLSAHRVVAKRQQRTAWYQDGVAVRNGKGNSLDVHKPQLDSEGARIQLWSCNQSKNRDLVPGGDARAAGRSLNEAPAKVGIPARLAEIHCSGRQSLKELAGAGLGMA